MPSLALFFGGVAKVKEEYLFVDYGKVESEKVHWVSCVVSDDSMFWLALQVAPTNRTIVRMRIHPIMLSSLAICSLVLIFIGISVLCELADILNVVDVLDSLGDCFVLVKQVHKVSAVLLELCVCDVLGINLGYELSYPKDSIEIEFTL